MWTICPESAAYWVVISIQILGLAGMVAARASKAAWGQWACLVGIVLVGGASICTMWCGSGLWMPCGATLALVAVGATWETGFSVEPF